MKLKKQATDINRSGRVALRLLSLEYAKLFV